MENIVKNGFDKVLEKAILRQESFTWDTIEADRAKCDELKALHGEDTPAYREASHALRLSKADEVWGDLNLETIYKKCLLIIENAEDVPFNFNYKNNLINIEAVDNHIYFVIHNNNGLTISKDFHIAHFQGSSDAKEKIQKLFEKANLV